MTGPTRLPAWAWPLLALPLVAGAGLWAYREVAGTIRASLESSLRTLLASDVSTLRQWLEAEADLATVGQTTIRAMRDWGPRMSRAR